MAVSGPGLRVAVTRHEPHDGPLSRALRQQGLEPVLCPAVREAGPPNPERLAAAANALNDYDWLMVTSRRAIAAVQKERTNEALPASLRTAAVGESTAAALVECGAVDPLRGRGSGVMALIEALPDIGPWTGRRVLLPRAEEGRSELGEALRAAGATVDEVIAYRTVPLSAGEIIAAWRTADPDAAVIASPSAARALVDAIGAEALRGLRLVAAMGVTTQEALERLGVTSHAPQSASFPAVAALVADHLGNKARRGEASPVPGQHHAFRHEGGVS